jgi:hypothetical protein
MSAPAINLNGAAANVTEWLKRKMSIESSPPAVNDLFEDIDISEPLYEGIIFKQQSSGSGFNKRYFVLYPGMLLYYEHKRDYMKDLKAGMKNFKLLKLDGVHMSLVNNVPPKVKFCFNVHLPHPSNHRNDILLAFYNRRRKKHWMHHLQTQITFANKSEKKIN